MGQSALEEGENRMLDRTIWFTADDWFFEAINFSFILKGRIHQGLISYSVLQERFCGEKRTRDIPTMFACHRDQIRRAASEKVICGDADPIEVEFQDL
jgi:hypothetical protein